MTRIVVKGNQPQKWTESSYPETDYEGSRRISRQTKSNGTLQTTVIFATVALN